MKTNPNRIPNHPITSHKKINFTFDGKKYSAFVGDTLASALLSNNIRVVGRSFKYHRPRGILGIGVEEPNALMRIGTGSRVEPNIPATQIEVFDGLVVESQNRWPSLRYDFGAINSFFSRLIPAGFYYKTFMWPSSMWEKYEWFIRRAAGLGKAADEHEDPDRYEHIHFHCDVLIAGGGLSGLISAFILGSAGARVLIADEKPELGGNLLYEDDIKIDNSKSTSWVKKIETQLREMKNIKILKRSTVFGYHDHNYITISERCTDHLSEKDENSTRHRLWKVRAKEVLIAQGMHERPQVISGNDIPGVMLSSAVRGYVNKFGVIPGRNAIITTNNDDAYRTAIALKNAGIKVIAIIDSREKLSGELSKIIKKHEFKIFLNHVVSTIHGKYSVKSVEVAPITEDGNDLAAQPLKIYTDLVVMSGGWTPIVNLFSQSGGKLEWDESNSFFKPSQYLQSCLCIGGSNGNFDMQECIDKTISQSNLILRRIGKKKKSKIAFKASYLNVDYKSRNIWHIPNGRISGKGGKAFIDFQNDVTASDIHLASKEGYVSVEHLKRYTTTGMATDQGKTSNINALAILANILNKPIEEVGTTTFRMPYTPITLGNIGGRDIKNLFDPVRVTRINDWHVKNNAKFEHVGQWMRAWYYPIKNESFQNTIDREVFNARNKAGILDASTLGKIDIRGPDAGKFLDLIYTNNWSNLKVGKCRYGLMLKDDGMVMDDGVTSRFSDDHFHMTTTTGGAANVMNWLEEWHQTEWPKLKVFFTSVTEAWSVISISGPKARDVLRAAHCSIDLSNEAFEFMSFKEGEINGIPVRVFRISFTGELSFEINTPSRYGIELWEALIKNGNQFGLTPYGTEAMHVLRAERGFIIVGQETDGTVSPIDLGMDWIISKKKKDFIGKRSLERASMKQNDRKELVGLLSDDPNTVIPEGAHAIDEKDLELEEKNILGHVTSSYFSSNCKRSIAMALIKNGRARKGNKLVIPLLNGDKIKAKIVNPVFFDPNGVRKNGI